MARIQLDNVGLTFKVRPQGKITLKEFLVRRLKREVVQPFIQVEALQDISLTVEAGQRVGILGKNGAGKSTLLRVLAGIYPPTVGCRIVQGRISSLFEIALGFEQDASGWDNVYYRSYLQGESPASVRAKIDDIVAFSELGNLIHMPVRYYSAGMMVRLAFSIATAIEPEILLVDEVLAVGDMAFQEKARKRMYDMMKKAELIVMVSHDMNSLRALCQHGVWIEGGRIRLQGPMDKVVDAYVEDTRLRVAQQNAKKSNRAA
jgi:ABC-type polysaccharide/polyol phosphate transport system ATPase subunit